MVGDDPLPAVVVLVHHRQCQIREGAVPAHRYHHRTITHCHHRQQTWAEDVAVRQRLTVEAAVVDSVHSLHQSLERVEVLIREPHLSSQVGPTPFSFLQVLQQECAQLAW